MKKGRRYPSLIICPTMQINQKLRKRSNPERKEIWVWLPYDKLICILLDECTFEPKLHKPLKDIIKKNVFM